MYIKLLHRHYDKGHLCQVQKEMEILGAPRIRAFWNAEFDHWCAVEGCHRIRAAKALGLKPVIIALDDEEKLKKLTLQIDGEEKEMPLGEVKELVFSHLPGDIEIKFEDD